MSDAAHPPVPGPPRGAGAAPLDDVARPDSHPSGAASTRRTGAAPLDDVMMAMDVVDTLRHREQWVNRELDESGRQAALLERLRQIYRGQGIEVSDRVLEEGVRALEESRFSYSPPKPGVATALARLWVSRGLVAKGLAALVVVAVLAWAVHYALLTRPRQAAAQALAQAHSNAVAAAASAAGRERADRFFAEGRTALENGDIGRAAGMIDSLEVLRANLPRSYRLRIVSEVTKQVPTALHRRNHYLIVEAVAPDGGVLPLPVTSEEDGQTRIVSRWGIRVPEETYLAVERDRRDDGVLQTGHVGEKRPGEPDVTFAMPVLGGAIHQW